MHIVVGAGLAGAVIAERIANVLAGEVLVIERRDHIGGNLYDYRNECGITVHKYGPHAFHTRRPRVWEYLSRFTHWQPYFHQVHAVIDGREVPIPFNLNSLYQTFSPERATRLEQLLLDHFSHGASVSIFRLRRSKDPDLKLLGDCIYEKVFLGYTVKQWGRVPEELDPSVVDRVPVRISRNDNYFEDPYQAIPACDYTAMLANLLDHPRIHVQLCTDFKDIKAETRCTSVIYTGQLDEFFDFRFGVLPYRSVEFELATYNRPFCQTVAQVNYPNECDFTRITEFKHFLGEDVPRTTVAYEYSQEHRIGENEPFYPVPGIESDQLSGMYKRLSVFTPNTLFLGRLGQYSYLNMDEVVDRALHLFETEIMR